MLAGFDPFGSVPLGRPNDGGPASTAPPAPAPPASTTEVPPAPPAEPPPAPPAALADEPPDPEPPAVPVDVAPDAPPEPVEVEPPPPDAPPLPLADDDVVVDVGDELAGLPWSEQAAAAANETHSRESARLVMLSLLAHKTPPTRGGLVAVRPVCGPHF
jgi:hypothetical protein